MACALTVALVLSVGVPSTTWAQMGIPYLAEDPLPEEPESTPDEPVVDDDEDERPRKGKRKRRPRGALAEMGEEEDSPPEAEEPTPEPALPEPDATPAAIGALWEQRRAALKAGNASAAKEALDKLLEIKRRSAWPNMFAIGEALARESDRARLRDQADQAIVLADAAVALAPALASTHLALSRAAWAKGGQIGTTIGQFFHSYYLSWTEPPQQAARLGNALLALLAGVFFAVCLFALVVLYRHARIMVHDMHHLVPRGATRIQTGILGVAVLLAPIVFRLGIALTVLWWVVLMGMYYRRRERVAAALVLAFLAVVPLILPLVTSYFTYPGSRSEAIYLATRDVGAVEEAKRLAAQPEPLPEELYVLGMRARWSGRLDVASDLLARAEQSGAGDPELLTELGNIRFKLEDKHGAIAYYEKAAQRAPDNLVAHYNLFRTHNALANAHKGRLAHERAQAIDYDRVDALNQDAKRIGPTFVASDPPPGRLLSVSAPHDLEQHERAVAHLWRLIGGRQIPRFHYAFAAFAALVVMVLMGWLRGMFRPSLGCPRCGRAACKRCNPEMENQNQCGQCYHAFVATQAIDPQIRIKKEIEVHRYQARKTRVLRVASLIIAGAGHLLRGKSLRGLGFLAAFIASLLGLGVALDVIPEPVPTFPNGRWISVVTMGLVVLCCYGLGLWDIQKRER